MSAPNPILQDVRATLESDPEYVLADPVAYVETAWSDMGAGDEHAGWTPEQYGHALEVMRRWATLRGIAA